MSGADEVRVGSPLRWVRGAATAYVTALWGSLAVILLSVGPTPTLDATRPGGALAFLVVVAAAASFLGRGAAGISGALAGAASAYALAIITTLRAAERNWAFIAQGPAAVWRSEVTEALLRSLVVLGAAAAFGALGRELRDRRQRGPAGPRRPWHPMHLIGPAVAVVIGVAALGATSALIAASADTSIVLPATVPTVTATGRGALVTVTPASLAPGEIVIVRNSEWADTCADCSGSLEFVGPLSDADISSVRIGEGIDDWINRLPRPEQLWYGGSSLGQGRYAFVHIGYPGADQSPRTIGVGMLVVSTGPTPTLVARVPGDAPLFVWVERLVLSLGGAALGVLLYRRGRIARLATVARWLTASGLALVVSLALEGALAFYVSFAGSPF